jgi:uncharacterized protein (TIGR02145 family)
LQRAYEIAYTAARKGMWEEDTAGSGTFHYVDSWNGETYDGDGRDVRFLIQDMTPEICASATAIDSEAYVLDVRDQTSYHIVKARDNRCWMQDHLALDPSVSAVASILSSSNTNASEEAIYNYLHGSSTAPHAGWSTSAVENRNDGFVGRENPYLNTSQKDKTRSDFDDPEDPLTEANDWKFGAYYNFCAASAGTYCYNQYTINDRPNTAIDAEYDICPANWRLPTGGPISSTGNNAGGGEIQKNYDAYYDQSGNQYTRWRKALHVAAPGYFYSNFMNFRASSVYIWSSTCHPSDGDRWYLGYGRSILDAQNTYYGRYDGYTIRCIAK